MELVIGLECLSGLKAHLLGHGAEIFEHLGAEQVVILAGGVLDSAAVDIHEGEVYRQALDRTERQAHGGLDLGHAGGFGVIVRLVDGSGVYHQAEAGVKAVGDGKLAAQRVAPSVGVFLVDVLVIAAELLGEELDVEALVCVPPGEAGVERQCQAVDGLV